MRLCLSLVVLVALSLAAPGCQPERVMPTPEPVQTAKPFVPPPAPPVQGSGCTGGSTALEMGVHEFAWPIVIDSAYAQGLTPDQRVAALQATLDAAPSSLCISASCCIPAGEVVILGDHGVSVITEADGVHRVFWLHIYARGASLRRGQRGQHFKVHRLTGHASIPAAIGASIATLVYPDGLPPDESPWMAPSFFATQLAPDTVVGITGFVDSH